MSKLLQQTLITSDINYENFREEPISFPFKITPKTSYPIYSNALEDHVFYMERALRDSIPKAFYTKSTGYFIENLSTELPSIQWHFSTAQSDCVTIRVLAETKVEEEVEFTFLKILKKWLIPGKPLTIIAKHSLSFHWDLFQNKSFFLLEVKVLMTDSKHLGIVEQHLPSLAQTMISAIQEKKFRKHILNTRPLAMGVKMEIVHKELMYLLQKYSTYFDEGLLKEMSRFLALAPASFCEPRPARLISKIVASHYVMRAYLQRSINLFPDTRHLQVRYVKAELKFPFGSKPVL